MLSKWFPWDLNHHIVSIAQQNASVAAFLFYDPFIEKIVLDKYKSFGGEFRLIYGGELTLDWIEDNLLTLDLFASDEIFLIKEAEKIHKDVFKSLGDKLEGQLQKKLVFSFTGGGKLFADLCKGHGVAGVQLQAPRFWETQKYLDFLCKTKGVVLSYEVQGAILRMIEGTSAELIHIIDLINLHFPSQGQKCNVATLQVLVHGSKLDQFALATEFSSFKLKSFYKQLVDGNWDFDSLRSFFAFMQSHLLKILDPSYMQTKSKLSKYDKEIEMASRSWKKEQLGHLIKLFGKMEILAKKKSPELRGFLRQLYIRQFSKN